jgi:hypothetical protein
VLAIYYPFAGEDGKGLVDYNGRGILLDTPERRATAWLVFLDTIEFRAESSWRERPTDWEDPFAVVAYWEDRKAEREGRLPEGKRVQP